MNGNDLDDLDRWHHEFPILADTVYMISNSLGAMPAAAADSLADYARTWATRGVRAWEERWWEMSREIGDKIGAVIGAPAGSVSMHANVTTATAVALSCLQPRPDRNRIVCLESDFPSIIYLFREMESLGWQLVVVPAEPDFSVRTDRVVAAIDERTALVAFSHVLFKTSYIMDPAPIVVAARKAGAHVLLDGYQSAGIIPVNVAALGVDFFTGGCLKWLCGGPGAAFLATRPDLLPTMRPRFTGWLAHRAPFAFDTGALEPRDDAMRMMGGTPPISAYYASLPGLQIITSVGVDRIRARSKQMTARVLELADRHGFRSIATRDPERLAGTVAVDPPDALPVSRALKARDFLVDYRPGVGIRISPHFYNTMDEIDRTMATLAEIVERKAYDRDAPAQSVVT
ncbi:MAG: aminotransferase class V-fold PLP-dependent enzyme [Acidobacteria bacterium]|nr:aminotransferase class V-fold PLP-dependent enzyme [Acidobacteriota bacterium]